MIRRTPALLQSFVPLGAILLAALLPVASVNGQAVVDLGKIELSHQNEEQIRGRFGEPDREERSANGAVWRYGKSQIVFSSGIASAWIDSGELSERELSTGLKSQRAGTNELEDALPRSGWENDWRKAPKIDSDRVIDGLLEEAP